MQAGSAERVAGKLGVLEGTERKGSVDGYTMCVLSGEEERREESLAGRVYFKAEDYLAQLQILRRTSVMITTQGSHGFVYGLLPDNARVILIGTPVMNDEPTQEWYWTAFYEIPRWFPVSHVKVLKYFIKRGSVAEYQVPHRNVGWGGPLWDYWNADAIVNSTKLYELVRQGLWETAVENNG